MQTIELPKIKCSTGWVDDAGRVHVCVGDLWEAHVHEPYCITPLCGFAIRAEGMNEPVYCDLPAGHGKHEEEGNDGSDY